MSRNDEAEKLQRRKALIVKQAEQLAARNDWPRGGILAQGYSFDNASGLIRFLESAASGTLDEIQVELNLAEDAAHRRGLWDEAETAHDRRVRTALLPDGTAR